MLLRRIRIDVLPRIHLGLLSMHEDAPRINGGVGFAINAPRAQIEVIEAAQLSVSDNRPFPMASGELVQLSKSLELFSLKHQFRLHAQIRISGGMRTHVGMGSATAIRLGAIEALALLNGLPAVREVLVTASGRGGTSGIGINSYFDGGLVCDLGRPNEGQSFIPSSQVCAARTPLALPRVQMPDWPLLLCIPRGIPTKTQQEELAFFEQTTPLPAPASFEASYIALFEIYAAAVEVNYSAFCRGIERMQQTAWKRAERAEYGSILATISEALLNSGADCAGMSSLGPMLFCLAKPANCTAIADTARTLGCDVYHTTPANNGREVHL